MRVSAVELFANLDITRLGILVIIIRGESRENRKITATFTLRSIEVRIVELPTHLKDLVRVFIEPNSRAFSNDTFTRHSIC